MSKLRKKLSSIKNSKHLEKDIVILDLKESFLNVYGGAKTNRSCTNKACDGNDGLASNDNNKTCTNNTCNDTVNMNNDGCTNSVCT